MSDIGPGARVKLHYTLMLSDGRVAETTRDKTPLDCVIGKSDLLPAFEERLIGLRPGERARFEIPCLEAYGPVDVDNVQTLAREDFPADMPLLEGTVVGFDLPNGEEVPGTIVEVTEREVRVNFSHPLAGHDIIFEVEVLDVGIPA